MAIALNMNISILPLILITFTYFHSFRITDWIDRIVYSAIYLGGERYVRIVHYLSVYKIFVVRSPNHQF